MRFLLIPGLLVSLLTFSMPSEILCEVDSGDHQSALSFHPEIPSLKQSSGETGKRLLAPDEICHREFEVARDCRVSSREMNNAGIYNAEWAWNCSDDSIILNVRLISFGGLGGTLIARCTEKGEAKDAVSSAGCVSN